MCGPRWLLEPAGSPAQAHLRFSVLLSEVKGGVGALSVPAASHRVSARSARIRRDRAVAAGLDKAAGLAACGNRDDRGRVPVLRAILAQADRGGVFDAGRRDAEG